MHVATAIIITIIVVLAGLWPALADELEARRRDARDAAWTAARARSRAEQMSWARDQAHRALEASWDAFKYGWENNPDRYYRALDALGDASSTALDASQAATGAEIKAEEAQKRATLKSITIEAIKGLKG